MTARVLGYVAFCIGATCMLVLLKAAPPAPTSAPAAGDDDNRLTFLLLQLATDETSIKAVNGALRQSGFRVAEQSSAIQRAEKGNDLMDRNGGGPISYKDFYGKTASAYVMHDTGSPVYHQVRRPPQFDYIYRANVKEAARSRDEVAALGKRIDALLARRHELELDQSALWLTIAFQPVADREIKYRSLYRFKLKSARPDPSSQARLDVLRPAILLLRISDRAVASAMDSVNADQQGTIGDLDDRIESAQSTFEDAMSQAKLSPNLAPADLTTCDSLLSLGRRLKSECKNIRDAYRLSQDEGANADDARKPTFRGQLQGSLLFLSKYLAQFDDQLTKLAKDWSIDGELRVASEDDAKIPQFAKRDPVKQPQATPNSPTSELSKPDGAAISQNRDPSWKPLLSEAGLHAFSAFRSQFGAPFTKPRRPAGPEDWRNENGMLIGSGPPSVLLTNRNDFANFNMRFDAMINDAGNSGIFLHVQPDGDCIEIQIESNGKDPKKTGSIIHRTQLFRVKASEAPPANTWFNMEITVRGEQIDVVVDGKQVSHVTVFSHKAGAIGFQVFDVGTVVKFKNIEIQPLP